MKLHIHKAYRDGQRFHAYTRDKAGKLLKNYVYFGDGDEKTVFSGSDWSYFRSAIIDHSDLMPFEQKIKESIVATGVGLARLSKFPQTIFVFDCQYDHADARIYSLDEKLTDFHDFQNAIAMSPKGDLMGCDEIEQVGAICDKYYFEIEDLGIDLRQLARQGFSVVFTHSVNAPEEYQRRRLQRVLRERFPRKFEKKFGIKFDQIRVNKFSVSEVRPGIVSTTDDNVTTTNVDEAKTALPDNEKNSRTSISRFAKFAIISIVSIAGFAASAVAIMDFMEIKRADVIEFFDFGQR